MQMLCLTRLLSARTPLFRSSLCLVFGFISSAFGCSDFGLSGFQLFRIPIYLHWILIRVVFYGTLKMGFGVPVGFPSP